jgi:hypothetical protein
MRHKRRLGVEPNIMAAGRGTSRGVGASYRPCSYLGVKAAALQPWGDELATCSASESFRMGR